MIHRFKIHQFKIQLIRLFAKKSLHNRNVGPTKPVKVLYE